MKKNLIYLVAIGASDARFLECVRWCVHSLRHWGKFEDEILIITDNATPDLKESVKDHAMLLEFPLNSLFDPKHERNDYEKFQVTRLLIHQLIDLNVYKNVMYLDADILAVQDIRPLFKDVKEFQYSREFQPMSAPMFSDLLTDEELVQAKWHPAVNSGTFIAPAEYLPLCLDKWKAILDASPNVHCYDQTALNAAILRKEFRAKPLSLFSVGYPALAYFNKHFRPHTQLLHYCGNAHKKYARMWQHYQALLNDEPLQIHFDAEKEVLNNSRKKSLILSNESGGKDTSWIIALDDQDGIESHALVNQCYRDELEARGHQVISLEEAKEKKADVVIHHNYTTDFLSNTFIKGIPHIAVRTSDFGSYPLQWTQRINSAYDQLWVHTQWTRQNALDAGIEPSLIQVMPHGVDTKIFTPQGHNYKLNTNKTFRFLFVGGAAVRKGIDVLLKAYEQAFSPDDDVCLVIKDSSSNVFYQDDHYRKQIIQMANDPDKPEVIHIDDHLSSEDLASLYRSCTVGVWPYRAEGFLIPALECEACGTPTLLPDIGPTKDFSTARTSFLVPAKDVRLPINKSFRMRLGFEIDVSSIRLCEILPNDLAKAMQLALRTNKETLKAKRAASIVMAHGRFTWTHTGNLMEKAIHKIIESRAKKPV
jgi:glycosyltransferase involved in cell wall biosynthesis